MKWVAIISRGALYQYRSLLSWIHPEAPVAGPMIDLAEPETDFFDSGGGVT